MWVFVTLKKTVGMRNNTSRYSNRTVWDMHNVCHRPGDTPHAMIGFDKMLCETYTINCNLVSSSLVSRRRFKHYIFDGVEAMLTSMNNMQLDSAILRLYG